MALLAASSPPITFSVHFTLAMFQAIKDYFKSLVAAGIRPEYVSTHVAGVKHLRLDEHILEDDFEHHGTGPVVTSASDAEPWDERSFDDFGEPLR